MLMPACVQIVFLQIGCVLRCSMLFLQSYYAQNYTGIIGSGLVTYMVISYVCKYTHSATALACIPYSFICLLQLHNNYISMPAKFTVPLGGIIYYVNINPV